MKKLFITSLLLFALLVVASPVPVLAGTEIILTGSIDDYEQPDIDEFFTSINDFINTVGEFFNSFQNSIYILFPFIPENQVAFFLTFASIFLGLEVYFLVRRLTI